MNGTNGLPTSNDDLAHRTTGSPSPTRQPIRGALAVGAPVMVALQTAGDGPLIVPNVRL
ncbi:MAG: hypothetical protein M3328_08870 [Chloroflexota bacterium]|nr:hypothetical protein [Chloroflexota bacterium]